MTKLCYILYMISYFLVISMTLGKGGGYLVLQFVGGWFAIFFTLTAMRIYYYRLMINRKEYQKLKTLYRKLQDISVWLLEETEKPQSWIDGYLDALRAIGYCMSLERREIGKKKYQGKDVAAEIITKIAKSEGLLICKEDKNYCNGQKTAIDRCIQIINNEIS